MGRNIYLDIDGVILTRGGLPSEHLDRFLKFILSNYSVFWLTTRCKGNSRYTVEYLSKFLFPETLTLIEMIKPTNFQLDKTEAIDFNKRFFWLDDELFDSEINTLKQYKKYDSWIKINLKENPNQLLDLTRRALLKNRFPRA